MSQVIILGWDALDGALIQRYGLGEQFGPCDSIDTHTNPVVGEPHTHELWPSIITGQHPDDHGVLAATPGDGVDWDSPAISLAADVAAGIVPQRWRTEIGRHIRDRLGVEQTTAAYYQEHEIRTLFDGGGRAISIPNYETAYDRRHGLDGMRDSLWEQITPDRTVDDGIEPQVSLETVWQVISGAAGDRVGHTLAAIEQGHDLVFCWFGLLDTIGHIQPAMEADLQQRGYELAAGITALVRQTAPADATVLALSDHGLQCGSHTEYATLATEHAGAREEIGHVFDIYQWVQNERSRDDAHQVGYGDGVDELREDLEALGYV